MIGANSRAPSTVSVSVAATVSATTAATPTPTPTPTTAGKRDKKTPDNLLSHPQLWRAGQLGQLNPQHNRGIASGYPELDAQLPGGGWPRAGLAEVLHAQPGLGELRLLAPALADLSQDEDRWIAWINPPAIPYAPALGRFGIRSDRMLMIHPKSHADALWAAEQAARSGTCSAVLIWLDESSLKHTETRRLQVAAKQGNSLACLFRSTQGAQHASAAELRLKLHTPDTHTSNSQVPNSTTQSDKFQNSTSYSAMQVDVLKRRGGWAIDNININLVGDDPVRRLQDIQQQLSLWRDLQQQPLRAAPQAVVPASRHSGRAAPRNNRPSVNQSEQRPATTQPASAVVQQLH